MGDDSLDWFEFKGKSKLETIVFTKSSGYVYIYMFCIDISVYSSNQCNDM